MTGIGSESIFDNVRSGLRTNPFFEKDPPCLIVRWIAWDSGFRGSGLQIGDGVIAINDVPVPELDQSELQRLLPKMIGQWNESQGFAELGRKDGDSIKLRVRRRRSPGHGWLELELTGTLLAERQWSEATRGRVYGPGGPPLLGTDALGSGWSSWYERQIRGWERILNWHYLYDVEALGTTIQTRMAFKEHLTEEPRVQLVLERYPGPYAEALQQDWETVKRCLEGDPVDLPPDALAFRSFSDRRKEQTANAATEHWNSACDELSKEVIAFPQVDPFRGEIAPLVGKLVVLPPVSQRGWIVDMGRGYLAWSQGGSWLVAPIDSPSMGRAFAAIHRYEKLVAPFVRLDIAVIGRILPNPRLLAGSGRAVVGLEVEPLVVLVDKTICVDLRLDEDGKSPFAGETAVQQQAQGPPPDDATPRQVMEAMIAAVKRADQETWSALFADWRADPARNRPIYYPVDGWTTRDSAWVDSRRALMEKVLDVRVRWTDDPRVIIRGDEAPGLVPIEQVLVEIDRVGLFNGEARTFSSVGVTRIWSVQRRAGGPWRIATKQRLV